MAIPRASLLLLLGLAAGTPAASADDPTPAPFAVVGQELPGARVERVDTHAEYQRYWLRYPSGALIPAEATRRSAENDGLCEAGGIALYPRLDLAEGTVPPAPVDAMLGLCVALSARPPALRERGPAGDMPGAGGAPGTANPAHSAGATIAPAVASLPFRPSPLSLLAVALGGMVLALLPRAARGLRAWSAGERVEGVTVLVVGVCARLWWSPLGIFNGGGAAYEKIRYAWGVLERCPYGEGFPAIYGAILAAWGREPEHLFRLNRAVAMAAPPLLWALVRLLPGLEPRVARVTALAAGIGLALLPLHLGMSGSEAMHVPVLTFSLVALVAAAAYTRLGAPGRASTLLLGIVVCASGLVAHLRAEAIPLALVPLAVWLPLRQRGPRIAGAILGALVLFAAVGIERGQQVLTPSTWTAPSFWWGILHPHWGPVIASRSFSVFWHAGLTPPVLWPLAVIGVITAPRRLRLQLGLAILVAEAPFYGKVYPIADAWRLQLASQPFWLILCGLGAAAVGARMGRWGTPAWALGALLWVNDLRTPAAPGWIHQREYSFLAEHTRQLPAGSLVWVAGDSHREAAFCDVATLLGPAVWAPLRTRPEGAGEPNELIWVGLSCRTDPLCTGAPAGWAPMNTTRLGPPADLDVRVPAEGIEIGWYRHTGP